MDAYGTDYMHAVHGCKCRGIGTVIKTACLLLTIHNQACGQTSVDCCP